MFGKRKNKKVVYDKTGKIPVIRASICTGEQVAGFKDVRTGRFEEVMLIKNHKDMEAFRQRYGILEEEIGKEY